MCSKNAQLRGENFFKIRIWPSKPYIPKVVIISYSAFSPYCGTLISTQFFEKMYITYTRKKSKSWALDSTFIIYSPYRIIRYRTFEKCLIIRVFIFFKGVFSLLYRTLFYANVVELSYIGFNISHEFTSLYIKILSGKEPRKRRIRKVKPLLINYTNITGDEILS